MPVNDMRTWPGQQDNEHGNHDQLDHASLHKTNDT
jgi:hypothetical protein